MALVEWRSRDEAVKPGDGFWVPDAPTTWDSGDGDFTFTRSYGAAGRASALEAGTRLIATALATARVTGRLAPRVLTPAFLADVGRRLIRKGEFVALFEVAPDGAPALREPTSYSIQGGAVARETWRYECDFAGITRSRTVRSRAEETLHVRYAYYPGAPWRGIAPLDWCGNTKTLLDNLERQLGDEAAGPSGYIIPQAMDRPIAQNSSDTVLSRYSRLLNRLRGGTSFIRASAAKDATDRDADLRNMEARRIGINPPQAAVTLRQQVAEHVFAVLGVPLELVASSHARSTPGFQQFLAGTVEPLGRLIAEEAGRVLDETVTLSFDSQSRADLGVRARSFKTLIEGGMDMAQAAAVSGILLEEAG